MNAFFLVIVFKVHVHTSLEFVIHSTICFSSCLCYLQFLFIFSQFVSLFTVFLSFLFFLKLHISLFHVHESSFAIVCQAAWRSRLSARPTKMFAFSLRRSLRLLWSRDLVSRFVVVDHSLVPQQVHFSWSCSVLYVSSTHRYRTVHQLIATGCRHRSRLGQSSRRLDFVVTLDWWQSSHLQSGLDIVDVVSCVVIFFA